MEGEPDFLFLCTGLSTLPVAYASPRRPVTSMSLVSLQVRA